MDAQSHIERALERAASAADPTERAAWSRVVIVGGGRAGVDVARRIAEIAGSAQVSLLEPGPRLEAGRELAEAGVHVWLGARVVSADSEGVDLAGGLRVPARTVIWARTPEHVTI
jgi:NADH dehydrogenase FAD-containing subunit